MMPASPERHHLEIEAMKLAWELRNRHIADPDFAEVPVDELLSAKTAHSSPPWSNMNKALDIEPRCASSDTIYLSVVDEKRLAVSFINSVYDGFGSCIVTPKTGIALQNRGACFVTDPDTRTASARPSARCTPSFPPW
jgi:gamma-glutamyltranspeptidase / glutathione hydrolase